jgi:hypothetical protein
VAELSLDREFRVYTLKKVISRFEMDHCVAGIDADRRMPVKVVLKYATNVDRESRAILLKELWAWHGPK